MPPPLLSLITWTRRLSSADSYVVVVVEIFMIILIRLHLRHCCRFPRPIVKNPPPLSLSLILYARCLFLILRQLLRCCRWVLSIVFLCRFHHCRSQFLRPLNTLPPLLLDIFNQARSLLCILHWRLCRRHQLLGVIFLCQLLFRCRQLFRHLITMP